MVVRSAGAGDPAGEACLVEGVAEDQGERRVNQPELNPVHLPRREPVLVEPSLPFPVPVPPRIGADIPDGQRASPDGGLTHVPGSGPACNSIVIRGGSAKWIVTG